MAAAPDTGTLINVLDQHDLAELPTSGTLMTILVETPPGDPAHPRTGTPAPSTAV